MKWKEDESDETACKINSMINGHFEECHGYEYYMEDEPEDIPLSNYMKKRTANIARKDERIKDLEK